MKDNILVFSPTKTINPYIICMIGKIFVFLQSDLGDVCKKYPSGLNLRDFDKAGKLQAASNLFKCGTVFAKLFHPICIQVGRSIIGIQQEDNIQALHPLLL